MSGTGALPDDDDAFVLELFNTLFALSKRPIVD